MTESQIKTAVRTRDGHQCTKCGMTDEKHRKVYDRSLQVHRITPGSEYTVDGCRTLCTRCHGPEPRRPNYNATTTTLPVPDTEGRYAALLVAMLEHTGWTEYKLAQAAGMKGQHLARFRSGSVPRMDTVEKLLTAAGLSWAWLDGSLPKPKRKGKK